MRDVPVNSVLLLPTRQEALEFPTGDIRLAFCPDCGFIYNDAFDASLLEYSERYEETQGYSPTFQRWHRQLAQDLIDRFELRGKRVVEIGCGKGEFLALLCERGGNTGVGFDPAYVPERNTSEAASRMEFVQDFYSEKYAGHQGDFVCCKMTLEHISNTADFVGAIRRSLEGQPQTQVFFQVPDTLRILEETAFWDVYYEHCSYFTAGSLARLFRRAGFDVQDVAREYGNQYLMIEAKPGDGSGGPQLEAEQDLQRTAELVEQFSHELPRWTAQWKERLDDWGRQGKRVVIWGSGSKGVSFLTTLGGRPDIEYVVDINPNKHGYFMARSGQEIVSPDFMTEYRPDVVVVMNPIYRDEIVADLERRNLSPEVVTT
jgi:SAM-dependent methyltransferase